MPAPPAAARPPLLLSPHAAMAHHSSGGHSIDPEDVVVAELDVVFCNNLAAIQSQLVMLQQPLRPNWRGYDTEGATAKFKPNAKRLEMSIPLDTESENYTDSQDEHKRIASLDLRSSPVDDPVASYAVGVVRGNELLLVPLDYTLQLRPNMAYLGGGSDGPAGARHKGDGDDSEDEDGQAEELTAVEVTVKRRETERQQQMRLKSFSHMQQEEQQEAWVPLKVVNADSAAAEAVLDKLLSGAPQAAGSGSQQQQQQQALAPLSRADYLAAFVPAHAPTGTHGRGAAAAAAAAAADAVLAGVQQQAAGGGGGGGRAGAAGPSSRSPSVSPLEALPEGMATAVGPLLKSLFQRHTLCTMANVRQWLGQQRSEQAVAAAALEDALLQALLAHSGHVRLVKRVFVAKAGPHKEAQGLREVALDLLEAAGQMRKGDLLKKAADRGVAADDKLYSKVTKELCKNNGSYWLLKTGADM